MRYRSEYNLLINRLVAIVTQSVNKVRTFRERIVQNKNSHICFDICASFVIGLSSASVDEFSWEWTVFKSNYPLTSLSRQKIHIIRRCIPCQAMNWTWSDNRNSPKLAKNSGQLRRNFSSDLVNMLTNGCHRPEAREQLVGWYRKVSFRRR